MIVAGELSGDIHAAELVKAIKERDPSITFSGLGGPHLNDTGVTIYDDLTKMAVFGIVEVFKHIFQLRKIFHRFITKATEIRPDAVILVDYPGFNLRLAQSLKKRGIKIIYYISPKVWVWKENRVKTIKKYVDRMITIFNFETAFYAKRGYAVDFVGNPLTDQIHVTTSRYDLLVSKGLNPSLPTIGLVPGSRVQEIKNLLPIMIKTASIIRQRVPNAQFLLTKARSLESTLINDYIHDIDLPITVIENDFHNTLNACDACLVTSGTATLETALLEKPMVVIYKTTWLTSVLVRIFIKIKLVSLVNIIAGKEIVPECIQEDATPQIIAEKFLAFYTNPFRMETTINALKDVKKKLGGPGAARRAAEIVISEIYQSS